MLSPHSLCLAQRCFRYEVKREREAAVGERDELAREREAAPRPFQALCLGNSVSVGARVPAWPTVCML